VPAVEPHAPRLPGLDGLRGVAALAVVAYHLELGVLPAGFLGVDLFFTISGFIITALLVREFEASGRVALGAFWMRRVRRLVPPTFAVVAVALVLTPVLAPQALPRLHADTPAALAFVSNWWQLATAQSYFEAWGSPPLLQHLWSLAVEEQYYLVWPLLAVALLRRGGRPTLGWAAFALALASTAAMAWHFAHLPPGADPSRAYLGTDTHAMGLLLGSALACAARPWAPRGPLPGVDALAAAAGLALLALMALLHGASAVLYLGGFLLASALATLLILAGLHPQTWVQRLLESAPMRWAGTRSFALYLWHWPVVVWMPLEPGHPLGTAGVTLARLAFTALAAELSHRLIEEPLRRAGPNPMGASHTWAVATGAGAGAAALGMAHSGNWPPAPPSATQAYFAAAVLPQEPPPRLLGSALEPEPDVRPARPWSGPANVAVALPGNRVTVIGDSVMLGARGVLEQEVPGLSVDAEVGRHAWDAARVVRGLRERLALGEQVVWHLGTNSLVAERTLRDLLQALSDRPAVVLVTAYARRPWTASNNALVRRLAAEYPNARVVDWAALAETEPGYLVEDGVHLSAAGMRALAQALAQTLDPGR
jgi:peptidoglycan/LPS O-acetylase OafA/YrhL